jgi:hypothetical protein
MLHKLIYIIASILVFFVIDLSWVYPPLFNYLPQVFSWVIASALIGFEVIILIAEWHYLDWEP